MLSIIVTWRDRSELGQALPALLDSSRLVGGDVTVVNFGGDAALLEPQLHGRPRELRVATVEGPRYFHKATANNVGIAATDQPYLFFCDCDILLEPALLGALIADLREAPDAFLTLQGVRESERNSRRAKHVVRFGYELRLHTADGRELRIVDSEEDANDGTRNAPGLLMVRRDHILEAGGFNSELHGWGWEDQDMIARLTLGLGLRRITRGQAVHISHDDRARTAAYPVEDRWESRDRTFRQALANYDEGRFGGTLESDTRGTPWSVDRR